MAKEIACPTGEYLVATRELGAQSSSLDYKAPHHVGSVSVLTTVRQATSDDFPRDQRRSKTPSSMFSDLSLPLRI
jgi:hypothetical protein